MQIGLCGITMTDAALSTDGEIEKRRKAREAKAARGRVRPPQAFRYEKPDRDAGKTEHIDGRAPMDD